MLTFLVGGARSGKSTLAVQMGLRSGAPVTFVATAEPFDDDLRERVARHRAERPPLWTTVECPIALGDAVAAVPDAQFLIVDCLTVWLANLFQHEPSHDVHVAAAVQALHGRQGRTVVVSNEVGMGVHPETGLGRGYRDALGRVNQLVAAGADTTLLLVAGRAVRLDDPWELLS